MQESSEFSKIAVKDRPYFQEIGRKKRKQKQVKQRVDKDREKKKKGKDLLTLQATPYNFS